MNFRAYYTLTDLKVLVGNYDPDSNQSPYDRSQQDNNMRSFLIDASRLFDEEVNRESIRKRTFAPVYETRYFNSDAVDYPNLNSSQTDLVSVGSVSATDLYLLDDLLAADSVTTKNGATTLTTSDYWLLRRWGRQRDRTPYDMIRLKEDGSVTAWESDTDGVRANAVTGWWGYHEDWANAWVDSGDVLGANIASTTATTFTGTDVDGKDPYGRDFRLKEMQLIRINTEYMFITAVDPETNVCTVVRGVNGTTAATHTSADVIYTFEPQAEARSAVWAWALYLLNRKNSVGSDAGGITVSNRGDIFVPGRMPPEVQLYAQNLQTARL